MLTASLGGASVDGVRPAQAPTPDPGAAPAAAAAWAFTSAVTANMMHLGRLSIETVLLFIRPLAFVACALTGLGLLLYRFRQFRSRLAAWYRLLTYGGLGFLVAVLGTYGWLGMRL